MYTSIPIEYEKFSNKSIQLIDGNLKGVLSPDQSRRRSNGNERGALHSPDLQNWS